MKLKSDLWSGDGITVSELIELLRTLPQDMPVTRYEDEIDSGFPINEIGIDDDNCVVFI